VLFTISGRSVRRFNRHSKWSGIVPLNIDLISVEEPAMNSVVAAPVEIAFDGVPARKGSRLMTIAAMATGNILEFYDFAVYAYLASILGRNFFPAGSETVSLLSAFAVFGVGFLIRPLGGFLIGRFGDRHGRKPALLFTIVLMSIGTGLIGVIPTYAQIGIAAPIMLTLARLLQGFSAGGEWGGGATFIVEWAPPGRRGFYGGIHVVTIYLGLALGSAVAAALSTGLSPETMTAWGWRVPFIVGAIIGPLGLIVRRKIDESPVFVEAQAQPEGETARGILRTMGHAFCFAAMQAVLTYVFLGYFPTFTQKFAGLSASQALWSTALAIATIVPVGLLSGALSDRIGRKPPMIASCVGFVVLAYPMFYIVVHSASVATVMAVQAVAGMLTGLFLGTMPATLVEMFPTKTRLMGLSTSFNASTGLFGGFAPFIATWLVAATGAPTSVAFFVSGAAVVSLVAVLMLKETSRDRLR
jgi:MHS family proline/betaine transporter-like MFS transporter